MADDVVRIVRQRRPGGERILIVRDLPSGASELVSFRYTGTASEDRPASMVTSTPTGALSPPAPPPRNWLKRLLALTGRSTAENF